MKRKNVTTHMMKEYIAQALLILMEQKECSNISINEVTDKAGVNRSTYYRNFTSKEDIITFFLNNIMQEYLDDFEKTETKTFERYMLTLYTHFYGYKKELLLIYKSGLAYLLLDMLNQVFHQRRMKESTSVREQYEIHYHVGGVFNFYILWFSHDMRETPDELTKIALTIYPKDKSPMLLNMD